MRRSPGAQLNMHFRQTTDDALVSSARLGICLYLKITIRNAYLTKCSVFLFAKSGNPVPENRMEALPDWVNKYFTLLPKQGIFALPAQRPCISNFCVTPSPLSCSIYVLPSPPWCCWICWRNQYPKSWKHQVRRPGRFLKGLRQHKHPESQANLRIRSVHRGAMWSGEPCSSWMHVPLLSSMWGTNKQVFSCFNHSCGFSVVSSQS